MNYVEEIQRTLEVIKGCNVSKGNFCPSCRDSYSMIKTLSSMAEGDHKKLGDNIEKANKENGYKLGNWQPFSKT